jgi:MFS family permease
MGGEAAFFVGVWGFAAYRFHATAWQLAVVMLLLGVASMMGATVAGVLIDRYGPRLVLMGAQGLYAASAVAITFTHSLAPFSVIVTLFGLFGAPIMTAGVSFAPHLTETSEELEQMNSLIEATGSASFVLGPALGALVAHFVSLPAVFYVDAIATTVAAFIISGVDLPRPAHSEKHPLAEMRDGMKAAYTIPPVRFAILMATLAWFGFGAFGALEPLFFRDAVGVGVEMIGWVNTVFGVGLVAGAGILPLLPDKAVSARGAAVGAGLVGLGSLAYVGTTWLPTIFAGALVWGVIIGAVAPLLTTLIQMDTPTEMVGRVMGVTQLHRNAGEMIPLAVAPALAAAFGVQAALIAGGVTVAIVALLTLPAAGRLDVAGHGRRKRTLEFAEEPISPLG